MTAWEVQSVPFGSFSAISSRGFGNVLISGQKSVSDGRSQPADLSSGCISSP